MNALTVAVSGAVTFLGAGLLASRFPSWVTAALSVLAGAALSGAGLSVLYGAPSGDFSTPWSIPGVAFRLALDPVSALFLVPVGIVGALGAVFATTYWSDSAHPRDHRLVRGAYGVLVAAMAATVLAGNGVVFLMAWEVMALAAFVLIATEHEKAEVREAAYVYLAATHVATLLLWVLFARVDAATGTFGFAPLPPGGATTWTLLVGLVGFGLKAGIIPFHVWLPGAHASAPSHVSALLSGILLKVGVYGIVRTVAMTAAPPVALGGLVLLLGLVSAIGGVAFALGQHDVKRLLAYHSIENIGIILLGIGLALMGRSLQRPEWVVLGLAGAFLHVWNHAFFKGLLFLAAGSAIYATGTRTLDHMGGLGRAMPLTAGFFVVGALAICGLPPLNGFVSELMIYLGLFRAADPGGSMFVAFVAPVLAMVGALAVACFVKVYGAIFLGTARTHAAGRAREANAAMLWPMGVLACLCAFIGLAPAVLAPALDRAIATFSSLPAGTRTSLPLLASLAPLEWLTALGVALIAAVAVVGAAQWLPLRSAPSADTWGCGYATASPRMQYTSSSFADSLVGMLSGFLRPRMHRPDVDGVFPSATDMSVHVDDVFLEGVARPGFLRAGSFLGRVRVLQGGHVNLYISFILVAALALLVSTFPVVSAIRGLWNG